MNKSSCDFEVFDVGLAGIEYCPDDVDAPSCEGDDGLVVPFSFGGFSVVEGFAFGVRESGASGANLAQHASVHTRE